MQFLIPLLARLVIPASRIFTYIFFGISASVTWLLQFLKWDKLPEPAKMIIKIFAWGMLITLPVFLLELGFSKIIVALTLPQIIISFLYWFLAIALVEEFFKYLIVRVKVIKSYEFDEPVDAMIYMIAAALGFAALENILYLLPPAEKIFALSWGEVLSNTVVISLFRFIGATFLHALCSGLVGYFLAISIYKYKRCDVLAIPGLFLAVLLHGLYNFSIIGIEAPLKFVIPALILLGLAIFIILGFNKLKRMKSVCILPRK